MYSPIQTFQKLFDVGHNALARGDFAHVEVEAHEGAAEDGGVATEGSRLDHPQNGCEKVVIGVVEIVGLEKHLLQRAQVVHKTVQGGESTARSGVTSDHGIFELQIHRDYNIN